MAEGDMRTRVLVVGLVLSALLAGATARPEPVSGASAAEPASLDLLAPYIDLSQIPDYAVEALREDLSYAESRELSSADLDYLTENRERLGMNAERQSILDLYSSPRKMHGLVVSGTDFLDMIVTPEEAAELIMRNYLQWTLITVNQYLRNSDPSFVESAIRFDQGIGKSTATFLFATENHGDSLRKITEMFPEALRDRIREDVAPVSPEQIRERGSEVSAFLDSLTPTGGLGFALDYWHGLVKVSGPDPSLYERLVSTVGPDRLTFERREADSDTTNKDEQQIFGLVFSSLNLNGACTSGFATTGPFGPMLLTAGHCFGMNFMAQQGLTGGGGMLNVGQVVGVNTSGDFDAEMISPANTGRPLLGRIHNHTGDSVHQITGWIGANTDFVGMHVCQSGITTAGNNGLNLGRCGDLYELSYRPNVSGTSYNPVFRLSSGDSRNGDSGGGIWWESMFGSLAVQLMKGHRCSGDCAADSILTHLPYVTNAWGLTISTN